MGTRRWGETRAIWSGEGQGRPGCARGCAVGAGCGEVAGAWDLMTDPVRVGSALTGGRGEWEPEDRQDYFDCRRRCRKWGNQEGKLLCFSAGRGAHGGTR